MRYSTSSSSDDIRGGGRAAVGCLSRILRRILCFSSIPLRSFDHFKVDERERERESYVAIGATPGIVARLMGLDSVPRVEPVEQSPLQGSADQIKTSRPPQVRRPRVFPAYQELEDDEFFILSFEKSRNSRGIQQSKREKNRRERKSSNGRNKENENPGNLLLLVNNPCKKNEDATSNMGITFENEDYSENSSPNSVLEFLGFTDHHESVSPGEISRLTNSKMRRPLSEELENCGETKRKLSNNTIDQVGESLVKWRRKQPNYGAILGEIGKFATMETMRSSWLHDEMLKNKHCLLEVGRDLASSIFDHLLEELVVNLQQF